MSRFAAAVLSAALAFSAPHLTRGAETIHVYGPGGPVPAMKEAAVAFGTAHGVTVEVTAGQNGLWEDVAIRLGDIGSVNAFRSNLVTYAANSALARQSRTTDLTLSAWLI